MSMAERVETVRPRVERAEYLAYERMMQRRKRFAYAFGGVVLAGLFVSLVIAVVTAR